MRILVADDDSVTRITVTLTMEAFGYEVVEASNGAEAWTILQQPDSPRLAILDRNMPEMDGLELCRRVRGQETTISPYLIILTSQDTQEDVLEALKAGADEFLSKPVNPLELRARVEVGRRLIALQGALEEKINQLQDALDKVKTLQGIVPICSYCGKIRNDHQYWQHLEQFISEHTEAVFSHGICPDCWETRVKPEMEALKKSGHTDHFL